ncbi:ketol-acid reductoisomerase [Aureococcus anophagefferens]|nr:ketol-acid reductoisomerase [Aureococcus anophagefferens]
MTSALLVALAATATAFAPTATPASRFGARTVKAATLASAERLNYYNSLSQAEKLDQLARCRFMDRSEFDDGIEAIAARIHRREARVLRERESNGFEVGTHEDLILRDIVLNLTPDKQHTQVVSAIMPLMKQGATLCYSHGFNIVEEGMQVRGDLTVIMVAPKCPGTEVRESKRGFGVPTLIAVHPPNDPKLIQYGWETITEALKHGGITGMMDRLDNPSKVKAYELADELKEIMRPLYQKHQNDIITARSSGMMADWDNGTRTS